MKWDTETIFIESVLNCDLIPSIYIFEHIISYVEDPVKNINHENNYKIWVNIRDEIINKFIPNNKIKFYAYNGYLVEGIINELELCRLKDKINNNELLLIRKIYAMAIDEYNRSLDDTLR